MNQYTMDEIKDELRIKNLEKDVEELKKKDETIIGRINRLEKLIIVSILVNLPNLSQFLSVL